MSPVLIYLYFMACVIIGYFGRKRVMGFLGFFLTSLVLSPGIGLFVLLVTAPRKRPA